MENAENHIDDLIGKYLAGEATQHEQQTLDMWLQRSEANRRYYEQMRTIFEGAAAVRQWQQFDTDVAWNKLKKDLRPAGGRQVAMKPGRTSFVYWRIAASVVLVLALGYTAWRWVQQPETLFSIRSGEEVAQDTLPDGSFAFLNKQSTVVFRHDAAQRVRKASLEGEAYFAVKHDEESFIIETGGVIIEDIGTAFNVKSYPDAPVIEVYVETGEVAFYSAGDPGLRLTAGETGLYNKATRSFTRPAKDDANVLAYKTRMFRFENVSLGAIVESLNEVYDTPVRLGNTALASCTLNVSFNNEPVEVIADIIAETLRLTVLHADHEIVLDGPGCE